MILWDISQSTPRQILPACPTPMSASHAIWRPVMAYRDHTQHHLVPSTNSQQLPCRSVLQAAIAGAMQAQIPAEPVQQIKQQAPPSWQPLHFALERHTAYRSQQPWYDSLQTQIMFTAPVLTSKRLQTAPLPMYALMIPLGLLVRSW